MNPAPIIQKSTDLPAKNPLALESSLMDTTSQKAEAAKNNTFRGTPGLHLHFFFSITSNFLLLIFLIQLINKAVGYPDLWCQNFISVDRIHYEQKNFGCRHDNIRPVMP